MLKSTEFFNAPSSPLQMRAQTSRKKERGEPLHTCEESEQKSGAKQIHTQCIISFRIALGHHPVDR